MNSSGLTQIFQPNYNKSAKNIQQTIADKKRYQELKVGLQQIQLERDQISRSLMEYKKGPNRRLQNHARNANSHMRLENNMPTHESVYSLKSIGNNEGNRYPAKGDLQYQSH